MSDDLDALLQQRKQRGITAPSSSSEDDLDRLLARRKSQPATTPATTPQPEPTEASTPVAEPKKSWWERANERLSAPKALSAQRGRGFVAEENKADKAKAAAPVAENAVPFESLHKDDARFKTINDMMSLVGKGWDGKQPKEEFVKDFTAYWRKVETNTPSLVGLANRVSNSKPEDVAKLANAYKLYEAVPNNWTRGAEPGVGKVGQTVWNTLSDPASYIGLGAGAVVKQVGGKAATGAAMKAILKPALTAGVVDAGVGATTNYMQQKVENQLERARTDLEETPEQAEARKNKPFEVDKFQLAVSALVSGVTSAMGMGAVDGNTRPAGKALADKLDKVVASSPKAQAAAKQTVVDGVVTQMDDEVRKFVKANGEAILGTIGPESVVADAKIRTKLSEAAVDVAVNVMKNDPKFMPKEGQLVSDAINRVFSSLESDEITDAALEAAIRQAGLTPEQFAAANSASISEAARLMQQYSTVAKMMNRLRQVDPAFNKEMENLYKGFEMKPSLMNHIYEGTKTTLRNSKGVVVSGVDTTVRNVMGAVANIGVKSAVKLVEGIAYTFGNTAHSMMKGDITKAVSDFGPNIAKTFEDTFRPYYYLANKGLANDLSELLTIDNPAIRARLMGTQEDARGVSKIVEMMNVLNSVQDSFFRRAAFAESLDRQLSDVGLDLFQVLKDNGTVPKDVVSKAADDALKATMSYTPRINAGGNMKDPVTGKTVPKIKTLDASVERAAGKVVNFAEDSIAMNVLVPFPRFMANSLAWTYRHSPFGVISTPGDIARIRAASAAGDEASRIAATREAYNHGASALIGTTTFLAAIKYRQDNQDIDPTFIRNDDGSVTDTSTTWPLPQYLALADVFVKHDKGLEADSRKAMETLLGIKVPAGAQATFIDTILATTESDDKMDELLKGGTKMVADVFGRFTQPFLTKQVFDVVDMLNQDTAARDPNVVNDPDSLTEPAINRLKNRLGPLKYDLEKAVPKGGDVNTIEREGEVINRIVGVRFAYDGSDLQKLMRTYGLKDFDVFNKPTGDKALDNEITKAINEVLPERVQLLVNSPDFKDSIKGEDMSIARDSLKNMIRGVVTEVSKAKLEQIQDPAKRAKLFYRSLPAERRKQINREYERRHGVSLEEVNDYEKAESINAEIDAQTFKYNKGGFVQRRY